MKKINIRGKLEDYIGVFENWREWTVDYGDPQRSNLSLEPNIECYCGSTSFGICWWDYPHTGGYCKIVCVECEETLTLIDDYS